MFRCLLLLVLSVILGSCTTIAKENDSVRSRTSLDKNWKFIQEDVVNGSNPDYDDKSWRELNVPHDWSIEGEYAENHPAGRAGAYLPTGIGWYRKSLDIKNLSKENRYFIEFDGVYMNSDVWINSHHLGNRPYGYIGFAYDLTPFLKEGENTIAVKVDHSLAPSGRWYTGSGIYRHVWLTKTSNIYIPQWGTFVTTPEVSKKEAKVSLQIDILNKTNSATKLSVKSSIINNSNTTVATSNSDIEIKDSVRVVQNFTITKPKLWSPASPNMYTVKTDIYNEGILVDTYTTPLGVRKVEVRGSKGFFLNGEPLKLKGLSNHHDAGPVGAAVPNDVLYKRLKSLKEMGCNALRTTHNPFAPEFYVMCDTMGFMVMDEAFDGWFDAKAKHDYGNYFEKWWKKDLSDFMRRDRNHPSVIMWSIGNEIPRFTADQQKLIVDYTLTIDSTRPISQGRGYSAPHIDISGFNGHGEFRGVLEKHHAENPDRAIIGTEITHTLQTRGIYRTRTWYRTKDNPAPWEKPHQFKKMENKVYKIPHLAKEEVFTDISPRYQSSYDNSIVRIGVRDDWNRVEDYDYYIGNFRWTGFDYLGESFNWPARTANFGIIDLAGFPKDHYYLYQSLWSDKPMVHLLPHWTHPGKEGVEIPVVVYTNTGGAELFLNEKSLGKKKMTRERQIVWNVPYASGTLTVVAHDADGNKLSKSYTTAGEATSVEMIVDRNEVTANETDVIHCEISIVDSKGTYVPNANQIITFDVEGPARIIGVENGDILDLSPHKVNYRKTFNGKCLLLIETTDKAGTIKITAGSKGFKSDVVKIKSIK